MIKEIDIIPIQYVQQSWHLVKDYFESAMAHAKGECTAEQLKVYCVQGQDQIMVYLDDNVIVGAVEFEFHSAPNDKIMFINAIGGKTSKEHTALMFDWAKAQGVTTVRGCARESVMRLWRMKYGFDEIYRVVEKRL